MANGTDVAAESQAYLGWLYNHLKALDETGEGFGDPDEDETWGGLGGASQAYQMLANAYALLGQGIWGTSAMYQLPFVSEYFSLMKTGQQVFPTEEALPEWATEGQVVVPNKLVRLPDGGYTDFSGIKVDADTALRMIQDWLAGLEGDGQELSAAEQASLDLAMRELAWEKEQFGTLSAFQKEQIDVARQELGLERQEWLAGLMASPADFIERWYAEHLPAGAEMPKEYPWGAPAAGTEAWAQQRFGGAVPTGVGGEGITFPYGEDYSDPRWESEGGARGAWIPPWERDGGAPYPPSPPTQLANAQGAWQPPVGMISPTQEGYTGGYPALGVNEQGLYFNQETGQVYPIDPETGRQVSWYDPATDTHGRFIASAEGTPYGTYEYGAPSAMGEAGGQPWALQEMKSRARGDIVGQQVLTGPWGEYYGYGNVPYTPRPTEVQAAKAWAPTPRPPVSPETYGAQELARWTGQTTTPTPPPAPKATQKRIKAGTTTPRPTGIPGVSAFTW